MKYLLPASIEIPSGPGGLLNVLAQMAGHIWQRGRTKEEAAYFKGKQFDELFVVEYVHLADSVWQLNQSYQDLMTLSCDALLRLSNYLGVFIAYHWSDERLQAKYSVRLFFSTILGALMRLVLGSAHLSRSVRFAYADYFVPNARVEAFSVRCSVSLA